ncbi:pilus assembly protein CpaB [Thermanaeromonas toyohensis ToBE]|uniref:Pilus assembly protein CpaB n=1 Tax=Thermanaeromonas toyohensis ToBE TaxID=698762 RepID=A0A1W1VSZ0_9FIRM|nr:hypothetical protein [Thermanaeromonas toyohensis]SMB96492.1 pilus assembly protein CpaB [Thermanaeromonas toyohensis ToBE]
MLRKKSGISQAAVAGIPGQRSSREASSWLLLGALVCAVLAGLLVVAFLRAAAPSVAVFVFKKEMLPGDRVTASVVESRVLPAVAVPRDAVKSLSELEGKHVRFLVSSGDIVRTAHLLESSGSSLALRLAFYGGEDFRAVALPREASAGLAVEPGDLVDIYAYVPVQGAPADTGQLVASSAVVVSGPDRNKDTGQETGITVAVPREAAARIAAILGMNGRLLVALAPPKMGK